MGTDRETIETRLLVRRIVLKPDLTLSIYSHPNMLEMEVNGPNNTHVVITLNGDTADAFGAAINEALQTIKRNEHEPVH